MADTARIGQRFYPEFHVELWMLRGQATAGVAIEYQHVSCIWLHDLKHALEFA